MFFNGSYNPLTITLNFTNKCYPFKAPNVFITPHIAGPSDYNRLRGFKLVKENILRYIKGDSLLNIVDKNKGY